MDLPNTFLYNGINDLSGNISTPSTHSGANVISETGGGTTLYRSMELRA